MSGGVFLAGEMNCPQSDTGLDKTAKKEGSDRDWSGMLAVGRAKSARLWGCLRVQREASTQPPDEPAASCLISRRRADLATNGLGPDEQGAAVCAGS
jgi:hypothetical protein